MTKEKPKVRTVYPDRKMEGFELWSQYIKDELKVMILGTFQKKRA